MQQSLRKHLSQMQASSSRNASCSKALLNVAKNIYCIAHRPAAECLRPLFKNRDVLIVGPGPSYDKDLIRRLYGKAPIISLNAATRYMVNDGIVPDLFCCIDSSANVEDFPCEVPALLSWNCPTELFNREYVFTFSSGNNHERALWDVLPDKTIIVGGYTVTPTLSTLLFLLGVKSIILHGCDMCLSGGRQYARDDTEKQFAKNYELAAINLEILSKTIFRNIGLYKWGGDRKLEGFTDDREKKIDELKKLESCDFKNLIREAYYINEPSLSRFNLNSTKHSLVNLYNLLGGHCSIDDLWGYNNWKL